MNTSPTHNQGCLSFMCLTILLILLAGCGQSEQETSEQLAFAADNEFATNRIVAFLGDSSNIPGTFQDIPHIKRTFNRQNGFNFQLEGPQGNGWTHATRQTIINETARVASEMLTEDLAAWRELQRGGTMFFYMTSHGLQNGSTMASDGTFYFSQVAEAIRRARNDQPLERLIVFFDTCFSGANARQVVNNSSGGGLGDILGGQGASSNNLDGNAGSANLDRQGVEGLMQAVAGELQSVKGLYRSAIFLASSRPNQTAGDLPTGGVGTLAFLESINAAKQGLGNPQRSVNSINDLLGIVSMSNEQSRYLNQQDSNSDQVAQGVRQTGAATIGQVLERTASRAFGQTPVWCVDPPELADDFMFDAPPGYVPRMYRDAARHNTQRKCSQPGL